MTLLIAPVEALTDPRLTGPERRVLLSLYSFRNKNSDTVWPSTAAIAARSGLKDKTFVSKVTTGLAKKGWLTKKRRGYTGGNEYRLSVPKEAEEAHSKLEEGTNLDHQSNSNLDHQSNSNLDHQSNSNLDHQSKNKEHQSEHQSEEEKKTKKISSPVTFNGWLERLAESGEQPIPEGDPIFKYADDAQIPHNWLRLVWIEFKVEFSARDNRQKDWRAHFRNFVRKNYYKLWWNDGSGYQLTSRGHQAMTAMSNQEAA